MLQAIDMHAHIQTGERAKQGWAHVAKAVLPMNTGKWRSDPDGMAELIVSARRVSTRDGQYLLTK